MEESIGKTLAEELKKRAGAQARLDAEASEKSSQQKASDEAALSSLVSRVGEEIENFNQNAEGLPRITLTRADEAGPYTLMSVREVTFLIPCQPVADHASAEQLTRLLHRATGRQGLHLPPHRPKWDGDEPRID